MPARRLVGLRGRSRRFRVGWRVLILHSAFFPVSLDSGAAIGDVEERTRKRKDVIAVVCVCIHSLLPFFQRIYVTSCLMHWAYHQHGVSEGKRKFKR